MNRIRRNLIGVAIATASAVAGCGTQMTSAPSGFLSSYDGLQATSSEAAASRRSTQPIDASRFDVDEVEWRAAQSTDITDVEQAALRARLRTEIQQNLSGVPTASHGRTIVLRAAITRVEPVSPTLNAASALLLFVPLERGGAAVEVEAIDVQTGEQLAAMRFGYFAPMTELKARFSKLAPAELALKKAASDFARLLQAS